MRPLQEYDHLFTLTSVSEDRTATTDRQIWVWARPIGRAHTHSFRDASCQPRSVRSAARMSATSSRVGEYAPWYRIVMPEVMMPRWMAGRI